MTACTVFDNGVTILSRTMPGRNSASLGFWLGSGSRHEMPDEAGFAHLAEHLLFHGAGGEDGLNACTSKELTLFHGTVPGNALARLASRFTDMLLQHRIGADALAAERRAILQEMADCALSPMPSMQDTILVQLWDGHSMARPITGDPQILAGCTPALIQAFIERQLCGMNLHVIATGAVRHDTLVEACRPLAMLPIGTRPLTRPPPPPVEVRERHFPIDAERSHLVWTLPMASFGSEDGMTQLIEHIVCGSSDSRLHHLLRERHGLVYGIDSRIELHSDCGLWWLHVHCDPQRVETCCRLVEGLFEQLINDGPSRAELSRADTRLQARTVIEEDDIEAVMERIARETIHLGRVRTLDERRASFSAEPAVLQATLAGAWQRRMLTGFGPHSAPEGISGYTGASRFREVRHVPAEITPDFSLDLPGADLRRLSVRDQRRSR